MVCLHRAASEPPTPYLPRCPSYLQALHAPDRAHPSALSSLPSSCPAFFRLLNHTQRFLPQCRADSRNRPSAGFCGAGPSLHSELCPKGPAQRGLLNSTSAPNSLFPNPAPDFLVALHQSELLPEPKPRQLSPRPCSHCHCLKHLMDPVPNSL